MRMQCHRCTSDADCDFPDCMVTGEFACKRPTVGMEDPAPDVPPAKDWVLAALILTTAVVAVCLYGQVLDTLIHQIFPYGAAMLFPIITSHTTRFTVAADSDAHLSVATSVVEYVAANYGVEVSTPQALPKPEAAPLTERRASYTLTCDDLKTLEDVSRYIADAIAHCGGRVTAP